MSASTGFGMLKFAQNSFLELSNKMIRINCKLAGTRELMSPNDQDLLRLIETH